jgi:hypothetical protein
MYSYRCYQKRRPRFLLLFLVRGRLLTDAADTCWVCFAPRAPALIAVMQPGEALALAAQVAVTLAGFAGIVVVFRPQSVHEWSTLDKFRLRLLLGNSALPLASSLFGILLLTIDPPPVANLAMVQRVCAGPACAARHFDRPAQDPAHGPNGRKQAALLFGLNARHERARATGDQHCGVEPVLAVFRRDLRPSCGCRCTISPPHPSPAASARDG